MRRKRRFDGLKALEQGFGGETVQIPILNSREVTEVLEMKPWRLERFLDNYSLSPGQPGQGHGTRRLFSPDDVRRLAIAKWLFDDRLQPKLVKEILEELADRPFIEYDQNGEEQSLSLLLKRDPRTKERSFEIRSSRHGRVSATKDKYYALDFNSVLREVDQRVTAALKKRGQLR